MSDKTTAALAAEQADVEATTTQEPELLPAATLDELEQVDLGTVAEGERAPFRITDDRCADWAIRKIADERSEYDRLKALADEQIAAINEKVAAARKRMENGTSYLTSCLADFFATVPHKETKTTEKYRLLSGTLTFKKGTTKTKLDETKLVPWLKANGYGELVKVEESTRWADLKKLLSYTGDIATLTEPGEIVEGVTVYETPGIFTVDVQGGTDMAETKKTDSAAAAAPPEAACLTLRQKLVEMRKACPEIVKKQHSDGVSYKYAKIYDVWEKITPIMNELGVDFDVISEQATRHAENGDPVYWITMQTKTRNGDKLMFLYEADLTIRWLNLDNDDETIEATVHAVGWNDDPAKAKGAAHTYALKYYLFEKFTVDQGEDDPDNSDFGAQGKGSGAGGRQQAAQGRQGQSSGRLSDAQLARLYKKAEAAGMTKERTNARIVEKYKKQDPATLTRQEYDEICTSLDNAAAQHNQQGGNA